MLVIRVIIALSLTMFMGLNYAHSATTIVTIDMQTIREESVAIKKVMSEIKQQRDSYQIEITQQEESLREQEKKLSQQRSLLDPDAFKAQSQDFQKSMLDWQRSVQAKRADLDKSYSNALVVLQNEVTLILEQLSNEKQFDIALPLSQVVYRKQSLDVTQEVLAILNERLPVIQLKE